MNKIILTFILFFAYTCIKSQETTITGKVTAFRTIPLKNVKVISKKTSDETVTDENGIYTIKCSKDDVLTFVPKGFVKTKCKLKLMNDSLNVNLYFPNNIKNRELAVANEHLSKATLDSAIANLPNLKEDFSVYSDIYDLIRAKFPIVQIQNGRFLIPPPTFGTGEVLLMFNGVQVNDISFVQPREIKSIKVLRGNEAAIYGIRGGNGVIEIWTFEKE